MACGFEGSLVDGYVSLHVKKPLISKKKVVVLYWLAKVSSYIVLLLFSLPFIFSLCCPLNDRRRAAHSFLKIGRLFSLFLFSCPSPALLRLLILLLLLMSSNVHPNPGPIFPCFVCAGNVTRRGKSVQCCACSKWVHLRCSQLSLSKFRALGNSHSWSCPPLPNHCDSLLGLLLHVYLHCTI